MQLEIKFDEKALLKDVLGNLPEFSESFQVTEFDYDKCKFYLVDNEDGKKYTLTYSKAVVGLKKLLDYILAGNLKGLNYIFPDFTDGGNWDAPITDALLQMSVLGEVIYG